MDKITTRAGDERERIVAELEAVKREIASWRIALDSNQENSAHD